MSKKKVFITGAAGLLGSIWSTVEYGDQDIVLGVNKNKVNSKKWPIYNLNFDDDKNLTSFFEKNRIDKVINTIGFTSVERCESDRDSAYFLNDTVPGLLAKASKEYGCKFIHISF